MKYHIIIGLTIFGISTALLAHEQNNKTNNLIPFIPYTPPVTVIEVPLQPSLNSINYNSVDNYHNPSVASSSILSATNSSNTIGVQGYEVKPVILGSGTPTSPVNVTEENLSSRVKQVKMAICSAIENGDVKVWFAIGTNAEASVPVVSVGTVTQSGIEVTFHCIKK